SCLPLVFGGVPARMAVRTRRPAGAASMVDGVSASFCLFMEPLDGPDAGRQLLWQLSDHAARLGDRAARRRSLRRAAHGIARRDATRCFAALRDEGSAELVRAGTWRR